MQIYVVSSLRRWTSSGPALESEAIVNRGVNSRHVGGGKQSENSRRRSYYSGQSSALGLAGGRDMMSQMVGIVVNSSATCVSVPLQSYYPRSTM
jgi:hypothetical protein